MFQLVPRRAELQLVGSQTLEILPHPLESVSLANDSQVLGVLAEQIGIGAEPHTPGELVECHLPLRDLLPEMLDPHARVGQCTERGVMLWGPAGRPPDQKNRTPRQGQQRDCQSHKGERDITLYRQPDRNGGGDQTNDHECAAQCTSAAAFAADLLDGCHGGVGHRLCLFAIRGRGLSRGRIVGEEFGVRGTQRGEPRALCL